MFRRNSVTIISWYRPVLTCIPVIQLANCLLFSCSTPAPIEWKRAINPIWINGLVWIIYYISLHLPATRPLATTGFKAFYSLSVSDSSFWGTYYPRKIWSLILTAFRSYALDRSDQTYSTNLQSGKVDNWPAPPFWIPHVEEGIPARCSVPWLIQSDRYHNRRLHYRMKKKEISIMKN